MLSFFQINVPDINTSQLSRSNISVTQKVCNDNRVYFKSTELKEKFSRCKAYEALISVKCSYTNKHYQYLEIQDQLR